jgi:hypothetical protein
MKIRNPNFELRNGKKTAISQAGRVFATCGDSNFDRCGLIPAACGAMVNSYSVIPARFQRKFKQTLTGPPIKTFGGESFETDLVAEF